MKALLMIFLSMLVNTACKDYSSQVSYNPPMYIEDGLPVGILEDVRMDEDRIRKAVGRIKNGKYGEIHSMLIYKNDKLVLEEYFQGHTYQWDAPGHYGKYVTWNRDMPHCIHSNSKNFTSLCIGIAIDKGFIKNVHQSIFDYLPAYHQYKKDGKENITIEHLLIMTSGLQWEEWKISLASRENVLIIPAATFNFWQKYSKTPPV